MRVIFVPVADRPECARALQTAFDLGKRLGACVSGCHMRPHSYSKVSLSAEFAEAAWRKKSTKKAPAAAKALYSDIAVRNGFVVTRRAHAEPTAMWAERVGSPEKLMGILGPMSDLIVVSRPAKAGNVADMFLNTALTESGRPVLMLPSTGRKRIGQRVVIGWNQSNEAAAAVTASMTILQQAEQVTIVSCGPEDRAGPKSSHLKAYLRHWGINAALVQTRGRNVEAELMDSCKKVKADLLVGGAYSRSRWREKVFGGTTEFLIRKARTPVMLLHP